ncbi:BTAD domain-containing putative transcriptional regulator [Streptomyces sp. NBC_01306]|uniref:AfsR/SARP family transcriptional regulator n=1 Tax=Streptomyces sp. NBC_01306 TaxID=2903819 RepID=UPI00224EFD99|nr:BTAD domain-containing putative transcriptional regulator [Streptomyces sp. NBC_01306]MCX4725061.1 AfsR family transcriptional regulator [Streptomyces sp. NBC_01306]
MADLRHRVPGIGPLLVTDGPAYALVIDDDQLDLGRFDAQVHDARKAFETYGPREAVELLHAALELWRGPVLSGLGGAVLDAAAVAVEDRRLTALEKYYDLRLALSEAAELVSDLRRYVSLYPYQEGFRGQLMLALYRSGRRAEALEEYGRVREQLAEELGIDPGPQLVRVYEAILVETPEAAGPAPTGRAAPAPPAPKPVSTPGVPRTLPCDVADFVGRDAELQLLLAGAQCEDQGTRVVAIDGMGGVGKTSMAVRAAYQLCPAYPDGQLYIDLRGYSPQERPVGVGTALEVLLCALGLPRDRIPDDVADRIALWRATLAGKRVLLLFDNAVDHSVVSQLLPNSRGCLVLVTSRARLTDLDGAEWVHIDVMPPGESETLVAELLGAQRIDADPEAAGEFARLCGHLPLAIRIATARLSNRPRWSVRYLMERLCDEDRKLDELSSGERGVAGTLRLSYQVLSADCRATFRTLSLHPGRDLDIHSTAALLGLSTREAETHLETLLDAHLVQQPDVDLYSFHDLVRSYARSLCAQQSRESRTAAVEQLLTYYLTATEAACEAIFPGRSPRPTGLQASPARLPRLTGVDEAHSWFSRELITLLSTVELAAGTGYDRHAVWLARNVAFYSNARGNLHEFAALSRTAVAAARRLDDAALIGVSLSNLSVACWKLGLQDEGIAAAEEALELAVAHADRHTQAHCEATLGLYGSLQGRFEKALAHLRAAIALERDLGSPRAEAESLTVLSALYEKWGMFTEAAESAERAVSLVRRLGRHETALVALTDLALAHTGLRRYATAEHHLVEARGLCGDDREPGQVALTLALSAELAYRRGETERASAFADRALALSGLSASPLRRARVENMLGAVWEHRQDHATALRLHTQALETARSFGYRVEETYALASMARVAALLGDVEAAAGHRSAAEDLFAELRIPVDRHPSAEPAAIHVLSTASCPAAAPPTSDALPGAGAIVGHGTGRGAAYEVGAAPQ